ncbi:hypothetical protein PAECIP111802_04641 [Paenibacillus allorhizosphaerae]|uniref:Uncharacterized protein n=1 Tax=Paenibacillus allorhizosphaerae TaxID=2849866 RepID=A0ABM8VML2_9BACL|nr:hypothetical protein PAECIP111802_04641 [Paenibacillus allorhizosphaerae]
MFKHLLRKWFGSALYPKQKHRRYGSSTTHRPYAPRHSSSHRSGYGHRQQGHGYYKQKHHSSS